MRIRAALVSDAGSIGRVSVQAWRETYPGIVPQDFLDRLTPQELARAWRIRLSETRSGQAAFVVEGAATGIVGFAGCGRLPQPLAGHDGEFFAIYLVKDAQSLGFGRGLMERMAQTLLAAGIDRAAAWVFAGNAPARRFYERLGGRLSAHARAERLGGVAVPEVAYLWSDLRALAARDPV